MKNIFEITSIVLYFIVGLVCLRMSFKLLSSDKFLPFHEKAAGKPWDALEEPIRYVIVTLLRISGLGFLVVALMLLTFPLANLVFKDSFITFSLPVISSIFCVGLFAFNYSLYEKTNTRTPWKGSIIAIIILVVSFILSII